MPEGCDDNYITSEYPFKNHASVRNLKHFFFCYKGITIRKWSYCNRMYWIQRIASEQEFEKQFAVLKNTHSSFMCLIYIWSYKKK